MNHALKVDNSILSATAECSTKAVLRYVLGYTSREEKIAVRAGQDAHSALAEYFLHGNKEMALEVFTRQYQDFSNEQMPEDRLTYANTYDILDTWFDAHPLDQFPFEPIVEDIERVIVVPLGEGIEFFAKVDAPVKERETGILAPLDHKTTGKITSWWTKQFRLGSQMTGYIWSLGEHYKESVTRAYINAIEFGKLPDSTRKCSTHKVPYTECRKLHANWEILATSRSQEQLVEWKKTALFHARRYQEMKERITNIGLISFVRMQGTFNKSCTFCEFADFCASGRQPHMAESLFVIDPWVPWED